MDIRQKQAGIKPEEIKSQESLSLQIRDLISQANQLKEFVDERKKENSKNMKSNEESNIFKAEKKEILKLESQLVTAEGPYMTPMLIDQLGYLRSMLNRAEQIPGKDAYLRYDELKAKLSHLIRIKKKIETEYPMKARS
jgi:hypothetical protein